MDATPLPAAEAPQPTYLVAEEVAVLLRVTVKALYRLVDSEPTFPVLRLGRGPRARLRFPQQRLETWLRQRERGAQQTKKQMLSIAKPASDQQGQSA